MTIPDAQPLGQLDGTACADCRVTDVPLHRGETVTTRVDDGVVRDSTVVRCTRCLVASRRPASPEADR